VQRYLSGNNVDSSRIKAESFGRWNDWIWA
jgi:hypothetical protein